MAELKTKQTDASVEAFLNKVESEQKKADAFFLLDLFTEITKEEPKMWGGSIIGFGTMPLKYASGREIDWPIIAFSPRKQNFSIYLTCDISQYQKTLSKLGKYKTGKGCLYINKLSDIDMSVFENLIKESIKNETKH
ncbi:MAG: DUF1801 domain-containing protein [Chitinophagales bacterium]|nr:DUF1801 domain-containing protein [Chitinophagales bacterium]